MPGCWSHLGQDVGLSAQHPCSDDVSGATCGLWAAVGPGGISGSSASGEHSRRCRGTHRINEPQGPLAARYSPIPAIPESHLHLGGPESTREQGEEADGQPMGPTPQDIPLLTTRVQDKSVLESGLGTQSSLTGAYGCANETQLRK